MLDHKLNEKMFIRIIWWLKITLFFLLISDISKKGRSKFKRGLIVIIVMLNNKGVKSQLAP